MSRLRKSYSNRRPRHSGNEGAKVVTSGTRASAKRYPSFEVKKPSLGRWPYTS